MKLLLLGLVCSDVVGLRVGMCRGFRLDPCLTSQDALPISAQAVRVRKVTDDFLWCTPQSRRNFWLLFLRQWVAGRMVLRIGCCRGSLPWLLSLHCHDASRRSMVSPLSVATWYPVHRFLFLEVHHVEFVSEGFLLKVMVMTR